MTDESKNNPQSAVGESLLVAKLPEAKSSYQSMSQCMVPVYEGVRQQAACGTEKELPTYDPWGRPA